MDANFFYCSINMIDLYKDNHVRACVRACVCAFVNFSLKKTIDWTFTKFHISVPWIEVKIFSSSYQKNQACGAIQVLKRLLLKNCLLRIVETKNSLVKFYLQNCLQIAFLSCG